jgi:hypothetical protein
MYLLPKRNFHAEFTQAAVLSQRLALRDANRASHRFADRAFLLLLAIKFWCQSEIKLDPLTDPPEARTARAGLRLFFTLFLVW